MLAFSTTSAFSNSNMGWLSSEEPFSHNQDYFNKESASSSENSFPHQPQPQPQVEVEKAPAPSADPTIVTKKLTHNASERDRRKKINSMISSLRSLLPMADDMKKMSFPATINRVVKYIPDLQQEVEGLSEKKEELLLRISRQGVAMMNRESKRNVHQYPNSQFAVSNSWLNDSETAIQISCCEGDKAPLSEILMCLETNGHFLLNASSTETIEGRVFYNLHFQVDKAHRLDSDILTQKLLSMYEKKKQRIFSSNMFLQKIKQSSLI